MKKLKEDPSFKGIEVVMKLILIPFVEADLDSFCDDNEGLILDEL